MVDLCWDVGTPNYIHICMALVTQKIDNNQLFWEAFTWMLFSAATSGECLRLWKIDYG